MVTAEGGTARAKGRRKGCGPQTGREVRSARPDPLLDGPGCHFQAGLSARWSGVSPRLRRGREGGGEEKRGMRKERRGGRR